MSGRNGDMSCPLCGADDVVARQDFALILRSVYTRSVPAQCKQCGLGFMWPSPGADEVAGVYEQEYFDAYSNRGIAMPAEASNPPARYVARLGWIQQRVGTGKLLEIGPGSGAFLSFAKKAGWEVQAVETSQYAAERIADRLGLEVHCGTLLTTDLPAEQFDVVHMSHVLEHLSDPAAALVAVHRLLKPGGSVVIEVPNEFHNLQFRLLSALRLLSPYPVSSSHVFFFTPATLKAFLDRAGFKVLRLGSIRDLEGRSGIRQIVRQVASIVERPFGLSPLIEAIAVK